MDIDYIFELYKNADKVKLNGYLRGLANHNDYPRLDQIKYILSSPELKEHANVHVANDELFRSLLRNYYDDVSLDVIKYLIFEYNIDKTPSIERAINNNDYNYKFIDEVKNMFQVRELNESLNIELPNVETANKKIKI